MFYLISYDIPSDRKGLRRRNRISKRLLDFGDRVQESLFECFLNQDDFDRTMKVLKREVDPLADNIRIYQLCRKCQQQTISLGIGIEPKEPEETIVI